MITNNGVKKPRATPIAEMVSNMAVSLSIRFHQCPQAAWADIFLQIANMPACGLLAVQADHWRDFGVAVRQAVGVWRLLQRNDPLAQGLRIWLS